MADLNNGILDFLRPQKEKEDTLIHKTQIGESAYSYKIFLPPEVYYDTHHDRIIKLIRLANKGDKLIFYIGGYGGSVDVGLKLINGLQRTQADVQLTITAPVYSMHAILALSHPNVEIEDDVFFMFHDMSSFTIGKVSEQEKMIKNSRGWSRKIFDRITGHVLSKKEINKILSGEDLYIDGEEMKKRLNKG